MLCRGDAIMLLVLRYAQTADREIGLGSTPASGVVCRALVANRCKFVFGEGAKHCTRGACAPRRNVIAHKHRNSIPLRFEIDIGARRSEEHTSELQSQ